MSVGNTGKYSYNVGEGHISIYPWHYSSVTAGTWTVTLDGSEWGYAEWDNDDADAQNDRINGFKI